MHDISLKLDKNHISLLKIIGLKNINDETKYIHKKKKLIIIVN